MTSRGAVLSSPEQRASPEKKKAPPPPNPLLLLLLLLFLFLVLYLLLLVLREGCPRSSLCSFKFVV